MHDLCKAGVLYMSEILAKVGVTFVSEAHEISAGGESAPPLVQM